MAVGGVKIGSSAFMKIQEWNWNIERKDVSLLTAEIPIDGIDEIFDSDGSFWND